MFVVVALPDPAGKGRSARLFHGADVFVGGHGFEPADDLAQGRRRIIVGATTRGRPYGPVVVIEGAVVVGVIIGGATTRGRPYGLVIVGR